MALNLLRVIKLREINLNPDKYVYKAGFCFIELHDKERTILLGLYTNVLSELKEITEFWTQKVPALPAKVAPLPDVSKEDSNGKLYQIYKEHRDYLEELLGNYL